MSLTPTAGLSPFYFIQYINNYSELFEIMILIINVSNLLILNNYSFIIIRDLKCIKTVSLLPQFSQVEFCELPYSLVNNMLRPFA